jgi:hypothetical protein
MEDILNLNKRLGMPRAYQGRAFQTRRGCGVVIINNAIVSLGVVDPSPKELRHC